MIALPCSTAGTVTRAVERRLQQFSLPHPGRMALGQVQICPLEDAQQVAQYVAFAASVAGYSSELQAISKIGQALGKATCELVTVGSISVPLVGTGAGGLSPADVVARLREGFEKAAADTAVLSVFILRADDYRELATLFEREVNTSERGPERERATVTGPGTDRLRRRWATSSAATPPRVFISHTKLSPERKSWLVELYKFLRQNGINARLDAYSLRPGMDLVQWMCNELEQADRVLLICDERYSDLADGRHGGVGWETMLIQGDLYAATYGDASRRPETGSKYIPIVLTSELEQGHPTYLATKLAVHWPAGADEEELRQDLLRELFGVTAEPPLGPPPSFR